MPFKLRFLLCGVILFTVMPIVELALLIEVGKSIGTLWTIFIVIATALLGVVLLGVEGVAVIRRLKDEIGEGRVPQDAIIDGVLVAIGALLLITPGLITDLTGILLLLPPSRYLARSAIKKWIRRYIVIDLG